ncbi:hypothetical protein ACFL7M_11055 [Thermodesulfobacteriota bacterium]
MDNFAKKLLGAFNSIDGTVSVDDIFKELEGENWARFVKTFLRT